MDLDKCRNNDNVKIVYCLSHINEIIDKFWEKSNIGFGPLKGLN